jgi:glycine/D-amino acid oxidase-like deaminating enzyme
MARQQMILDCQRVKLLANGAVNLAHRLDDGKTEDFKPVVKLFNPCGAATWLLSELDEDGDTAFGLCDLGLGEPELGYVSLDELAWVCLPHGLYIERDIHFNAKKLLSEYAAEARRLGRIEVC